ncbi:MarR family transcriptional regulator [Hyphomicrobiales bacterium]|jgi:DNA-binding MarR family transcriptional regulator|nr:MarR family transcriptional regulator [Hyphomicrobiales bacterium]MDC3272893.1 MarR family transcriptional regulator [Hyphomicrobiales bacterium]
MRKKSPPKSIDPDSSIFLLFHKIEQKINSILNSILEKYNITPRQYLLLQAIDYLAGTTQIEIQNKTNIDRTTVSHLVRKLLDKELIKMEINYTDSRVKNIRITPKGRVFTRKIQNKIIRAEEEFLATLNLAKKDRFIENLKKNINQ